MFSNVENTKTINDTQKTRKRIGIKDGKLVVITLASKQVDKFPITRVTRSQIKNYRLDGKPYCLIKSNGRYVIAPIPDNLSLTNVTCKHLCSVCDHCFARPESEGGCSKICDLSADEYSDLSENQAIDESMRLEKYDFITTGFETIGTNGANVFIVMNCNHFVHEPVRYSPLILPERNEKNEENCRRISEAAIESMWENFQKKYHGI